MRVRGARMVAAAGLAWALACPAFAAGADPAPASVSRVVELYRKALDPNARLWVVDLLYSRALDRREPAALEALLAACRDQDPGVRRRAVSSLSAVGALPSELRRPLLERARDAAARALEDRAPEVREAARELDRLLRREAEQEPGPAPAKPPPQGFRGLLARLLLWALCFQLAALLWRSMGLAVLRRSGAEGRRVLEAWRRLETPRLMLLPALSCAAIGAGPGLALGWLLLSPDIPAGRAWLLAGAACAAAGALCLLPAQLLAAWGGEPGRLLPALRRLPGLCALALSTLALWPVEALTRLLRLAPAGNGSRRWSWSTGSLWAASLASVVMVREGLGWRRALARASALFREAHAQPGAAYFARAPLEPAFLLFCLASPAVFAASLALPLASGLSPTRLFGLWLGSDAVFAAGFGLWSGALLSAFSLSWLAALGAIEASSWYGKLND